ncbi:MAG: hypothetical protein ACRDZ4_11135 [Egibacteraceae bacterium]
MGHAGNVDHPGPFELDAAGSETVEQPALSPSRTGTRLVEEPCGEALLDDVRADADLFVAGRALGLFDYARGRP